jgi:hypothetical protein
MEHPPTTQATTNSRAHADYHAALRKALSTNPDVQSLLANYRAEQEPFIGYLRSLAASFANIHANTSDVELVKMAFREAGRMAATGNYPAVAAAYKAFQVKWTEGKKAKKYFLRENNMTKAYRDSPDRMIYENPAVEKILLRRLKSAYPPKGKWICESEEIHDLWHYHLRYDPKADNRLPRHEPIVIDHSKLQRVIPADQSCIIRDKDSDDIVLIVLRDVVADMGVLDWLDDIVAEATATRRNIRVSFIRSCNFI